MRLRPKQRNERPPFHSALIYDDGKRLSDDLAPDASAIVAQQWAQTNDGNVGHGRNS
jgi:hypothetical protein